MLDALAAPRQQLELAPQPFPVLEHLERRADLHARHDAERTELPLVSKAAVHENRLREVLAVRAQAVVVAEERLQLLALVRVDAKARHKRRDDRLVQLHQPVGRAVDLDEELVLGVGIADADAFGRRVGDVDNGADALARDVVEVVHPEIHLDRRRRGAKGRREAGRKRCGYRFLHNSTSSPS